MTTTSTQIGPAGHGEQVAVRSGVPTPIAALLNPAHLVSTLWRQRELSRQFTVREVVGRHRGTHLGLAWSVLNPLLTIAVFTLVFGIILRQKWDVLGGTPAEFPLTMLCGMTVFAVFADTVCQAPGLIVSRPNYVTKVVFPLEIFAVAQLGASLFFSAVGLVLLVAGTGALLGTFSKTIWLFPVVLVPLCALSLGVSWFLAALGVFLRDINNVIVLLVQRLLLFLTPVFYPAESVPESFRFLLELNPLTTIVENARRTLMWGQWPDWGALGLVTLVSLAVMQLGYAFFMKGKRGFADVL
jgi:lipopolysaccharide transport system permease protein